MHIRYIHTVPFPQVVDESESLSHQLLLSQWEEEEEERRHTFTIASRDQQQHKKIKQRAEVQIYWSKRTQHATMNGGQVKPAAVFLMLGWCCTIETNMPLQMEASCSVCCSRLVLSCTVEINMPLRTEAKYNQAQCSLCCAVTGSEQMTLQARRDRVRAKARVATEHCC